MVKMSRDIIVNYKLRFNYKTIRLIYWQVMDYYGISTKAEE